MTASGLAGKAKQLANSKLAPVEDIEGRLARWRRTHDEMAETLAMAAQVIDALLDERHLLLQEIEELKINGCPVGPVRRLLKLLWTQ